MLAALLPAIGGTPGFLDQVRALLRKADLDGLVDELSDDAPEDGDPGLLDAARSAYLQRIIAGRLDDALSPLARTAARPLSISELPLPPDAVASLLAVPEPEALARLDECVTYGLLQRFDGDEPDHPPLYQPPGLLCPWLAAPDRLSADEARRVHHHLAGFWRRPFEAERESELRVPFMGELEACRLHAELGDDRATLQWASLWLAHHLTTISEWWRARQLLEAIPEGEREAVTLHNLASIDLELGEYESARRGFESALAIRRDLGERAGVAETFHQLGGLAYLMGRQEEGVRLVALCWIIDQSIGHGDAGSDLQTLAGLCQALGYDQERFDAMVEEAIAAYQSDGGRGLIEQAFRGEGGQRRGDGVRGDQRGRMVPTTSTRTGTPAMVSGRASSGAGGWPRLIFRP